MLDSGNLQQGNRGFNFTSRNDILSFSLSLPLNFTSKVISLFFFYIRPLFSSDNINCNKHKMERFLHHGRFSVASIYAPICFPPLPLIVLNRDGEQPAIAAVGSLKSVDPDRIILKKIVLTGYAEASHFQFCKIPCTFFISVEGFGI